MNKALSFRRHARIQNSRPRRFVRLLTEQLESRLLLAGDIGALEDPPPIVAVADAATIIVNSSGIPVSVLANDTTFPATGQTKHIVSVTQPTSGGFVSHDSATVVRYSPATDFVGTETFTYTARNATAGGGSATSTATVTLTVGPAPAILARYQVRVVPVGGALFMQNPQNSSVLIPTPDLTTLNVGDTYDLAVTLQASELLPFGAAGGYLDIGYDQSKTQVQVGEVQNVSLSGNGSFALTFDGQTTTSITKVANTTDTANAIRAALEALTKIGPGNVEVTPPQGLFSNAYTVRFIGKFHNQDVANMTSPGGGGVTATITYPGDLQGGFNALAFKEAFRSRGTQLITTIPGGTPFYTEFLSAINEPNRLDELGALSFISYPGPFPGQLSGPEAAAGITSAPPRELVRARLKATAAGTLTFTPDVTNINRPANDTLIYGFNGTVPVPKIDVGTPKTVTIVAPPPYTANPDSKTIAEDANETVIDVLANDTVADGQTKQLLSATQPANGTVTLNGNSLSYKPAANFFGTDTFTYTAINSLGPNPATASTATVTVTVDAVNDAPAIETIADPAAILEDAVLQTINLTGILAGPSESQSLSVTADSSNAELTGAIGVAYTSPNATATLTYTPVANQSGTATITVTVKDGGGTAGGGVDTTVRTFNVTVDPVNDTPGLDPIADPAGILEDAALQTIDLAGILAGAGESQTLTITPSSSNPGLTGTIALAYTSPDATATLTYTPVANQSGTATITVTVLDGGGTTGGGVDTTVRTFSVTVIAVNDAPAFTAGADQESSDESGAVTVPAWATGISAGPPDEASQGLTFSAVPDDPDLFAVQPFIDSSGNLSYTPDANAEGDTVVTVVLSDDGGTAHGGIDASGHQTFVIRIFKLHVNYNTAKPLDATGDTVITAIDAVTCINHINAWGPGSPASTASTGFLDINKDGSISAADPLAVINYINAYGPDNGTIGSGEGEAEGAASVAVDLALADASPAIGSSAQASDDLSDILALFALDGAEQRTRRLRR